MTALAAAMLSILLNGKPIMRMKKVFRYGPHELEVTVPKGSVVAGMAESEKKVTSDAELARAFFYFFHTL